MNAKGLILRELGEGMTEEELASCIDVSPQTLKSILIDTFPKDPAIWDKFTRYFRVDIDVLQTGGSGHSTVILNLSDRTLQSATGLIRKIPLLD